MMMTKRQASLEAEEEDPTRKMTMLKLPFISFLLGSSSQKREREKKKKKKPPHKKKNKNEKKTKKN